VRREDRAEINETLALGPTLAHLVCGSSLIPNRGNMRNVLRIGLLLIVAWVVLRIVFGVVGFLFHLLLIGGLIFVVYYVITNVLGKGRPRQY
jgi:hypothetical protein